MAELNAADLAELDWTGKPANDQTVLAGAAAVPIKEAAQETMASSVLSAIVGGLLKVLLVLSLLVVVLVVLLLVLPDTGAEVEEDDMVGDALVGNWDAAFFCQDELQRAGRIMKSTNYVSRVVGVSHGHTDEAEASRVVRRVLGLTKQMHACVTDLWRSRGVMAPVTPEMLRNKDAWWNAVLNSALKSASMDVLERSQALHLALSLQLPSAVATLLARKVDINARAGPCGLTPLLRAVRAHDSAAVLELYRAGANLSAADCRGCLAQHLAVDEEVALKLRTWNECGPASSSEQCLRAHHGHRTANPTVIAEAGLGIAASAPVQEVEGVAVTREAELRTQFAQVWMDGSCNSCQ